jgi:6-phospho-beta-glucosidase
MPEDLKIAVIGGGSSYTPELIDGLIRYHSTLPVREVWLVDIEAGREKLEIVSALAKRMVRRAGVPISVRSTLDRAQAIAQADFIITQLRVGLLDARVRDEQIPLKYGCIGQETTGAGGFAKALRTVPVILDICRDMKALAPRSVLINFTNPAGLVTEAVIKYGGVPCVGVCNLPIGTRMQLARILGVDISRIETEIVGINHLHWVTRVWLDGEDITDELLDQYVQGGGHSPQNIPELAWDRNLLQALRAIPCSYLRYYYMTDQMLAEQKKSMASVGTRAEVVKRVEAELFEVYKNPELTSKPPQLEQRGGAYYSEAAVQLMDAMHNNTCNVQTLNVRNGGVLPFLPDDASIEVNCVVGRSGARPVQVTSSVGAGIRGLLQVVKAYEELTIEAAVHGDRSAALQALAIHPLIPSVSVAKQLLDDILAANIEFLFQFR